MPTITLNLDELIKEKNEHLEAIKHIDYIIEHFFSKDMKQNRKETSITNGISNISADASRMQKALDICEQYLTQGNTVHTMRQFLEVIQKNGIVLSRGGLSLAFKKPNSNIYFDTDANMWKLKNQG